MELNQIKKYHGERVCVDQKNGRKVEGALVFYNWEQQVIHLSSFVIYNKEGTEILSKGRMIIINQREWSTLRVK